ncbi:MAG: hypothetical protein DWP98_06630 [Bacteroidetes bacterium]|nr:MAG: hypothetical protein DWP98_06630 [Bacteroidota bacterium]MBL1145814.1 hypothetical protein [Bacteroidota bacterium]NOG58608.1 hypothetical protein [Bacteroidota bacterium]
MNLKCKSILILGVGGYVWSYLVDLLISNGCKTIAFVSTNSFNTWSCIETLSIKIVQLQSRSLLNLKQLLVLFLCKNQRLFEMKSKYLKASFDSIFISLLGVYVDRFEDIMCKLTRTKYAISNGNGAYIIKPI